MTFCLLTRLIKDRYYGEGELGFILWQSFLVLPCVLDIRDRVLDIRDRVKIEKHCMVWGSKIVCQTSSTCSL